MSATPRRAVRAQAELGAVGAPALAEQQVVSLALVGLAMLESERSGADAPSAAGRFSPLRLRDAGLAELMPIHIGWCMGCDA